MTWEPVIGIEIHVQLRTSAKLFCGNAAVFGDEPNKHVCPVCLGLPGALPTTNPEAVALAVRTALALDCTVHESSVWSRKNYFYPDLPKGYQITQFDRPLATAGVVDFDGPEGEGSVRIRRIHMEEDAGKSLHDRVPGSTAVDLNRAGTPLVEVVTEPDLRTPADVRAFLGTLKRTLEYIDVSDCNMEEGSLRCDANVSVRPMGQSALGVKVEVKNINSLRSMGRAIEYEARRQVDLLTSGRRIEQQTRHWNEEDGRTHKLRSKEEAFDYRYFPEPDLVPVVPSQGWIDEIRSAMPMLPRERRSRLAGAAGVQTGAAALTVERGLDDLAVDSIGRGADAARVVVHTVDAQLHRVMTRHGFDIDALMATVNQLVPPPDRGP
mgnify:CR=1 FL=1